MSGRFFVLRAPDCVFPNLAGAHAYIVVFSFLAFLAALAVRL
jgi:hypothetical protein